MIIREISLKVCPDGSVATLTLAVGKSAVMAVDLDLNGPSTDGSINVQSADLADAMKAIAAALPILAPTL